MTVPPDTPRAQGFRMPAEWEPHAATWLAWPHNEEDWPGKFEKIPPVFVRLATELSRVERVRFIVEGPAAEDEVRRRLASGGASLQAIDFFHAPTDRSWTRDFVPLFVRSASEVAAVKFRFDGWARYDDHEKDESAGARVADWLGVRAFEARAPSGDGVARVVLEGGAIDVDGEGTLLASAECLVSGPRGRNPWLGTDGLAQVLEATLGIDKVLWVGPGIAGDDTSGHVDDFVRFAGPGSVLLAEEKNAADPNHRALETARERLEGERGARGRRLEIVRLPMPAPLFWRGQRLPASYANYYLANGIVIAPVFDDPQDEPALGLLGELFPTRKVVPIRAVDLVLGLGTIHCSTHEEPAPGA